MRKKDEIHELKTWRRVFDAILDGRKTFEFRENDRNFKAGDALLLREWDEQGNHYTGRDHLVSVTYLTYGQEFGIPEGFVIMSIIKHPGFVPKP